MNYDEKIVKESTSLEDATTEICCYGFYDTKGVSKEDVLKYMRLGALWQKEQQINKTNNDVERNKLAEAIAIIKYNYLPWTVGKLITRGKYKGYYKMPPSPPMTFGSYDLALAYLVKVAEKQLIS